MFQRTKIRFIALVLASISIEINAAEPITEENPADLYLGSCYVVQYLKLQYCPSMKAIKMSSCVYNLTKVAHKNNEEDMQLGFRNRAKLIMPHIIKSIDQSFSKDLARLKGDRLRTCNVYQKDMNESMKKFLDEFKASQNDMTSAEQE